MMVVRPLLLAALLAAPVLAWQPAAAQQPVDSAYTARIRELTPTDPRWKFTTDLVDHLPASATVPSPLAVLGYVPGTLGRLAYVAELNRYFRALEKASPRVKVFSLGMSDGGREMIAVAIADDSTIARLDDYRSMLARLADPRTRTAAQRAQLLKEAKPVYWLTGSIHSPETGSPEMLMELAYRLAVEELPFVKTIRDNVITVITPATEVDGRDREVDAYKESQQLHLGPRGVPLVYWGLYTAHDNNRDAIGLSQKLTQHMMQGFLFWHPVVMHDLHESVPFLYTMTGTGPYNDEFDPIVVDEWHELAYREISELTKRGLPGVWTHGFYDGWAPNYMLAIVNLHNSMGRFYETYTSSGAGCQTVHLPASEVERDWDRPSPAVNGVRWCIRSNINYQESGVLIALEHVATHRESFLENFALKAERMLNRGLRSAPYAFVIPRQQRHAAAAADLVDLFRKHAAEVQVADADFTLQGGSTRVIETGHTPYPSRADSGADSTQDSAKKKKPAAPLTVHAGDWIIRMDQPYTATVRTLLAVQHFRASDPTPYDDTGWTLDELWHVTVRTTGDSTVLTRPMHRLETDARVEGSEQGSGSTLLIAPLGDWRSAALPWKVRGSSVFVADTAFTAGGASYPAGTYIIPNGGAAVRDALRPLGMAATAVASIPDVRRHALSLPRIALMHSWIETQNEGWVRYAFDHFQIPYSYIADQSLRKPGALDRFDVVVFPHVSSRGASLINGRPMVGPPIPWQKTALTPNLGTPDATDDMRPGMGLEGAAALRHFVQRGGLLVVTGNSSHVPVDLGFNSTVSIAPTQRLVATGAIFRAQPVDRTSPILYGYDDAPSYAVYFNQAPLFNVQERDRRPPEEGVDPAIARQAERQRARVILRFHKDADSLLVSGLLENGQEMAGKAAIVDAPVGEGHVVLFGIRPMWRWETQGSFAFLLNAVANWNHLGSAGATPDSATEVGAR